jgi:hypothetical protein
MMSSNVTGCRALAWIPLALAVMSWGSVPTSTEAAEATASVGSVRSLAAENWASYRLGLGSVWGALTASAGSLSGALIPWAGDQQIG